MDFIKNYGFSEKFIVKLQISRGFMNSSESYRFSKNIVPNYRFKGPPSNRCTTWDTLSTCPLLSSLACLLMWSVLSNLTKPYNGKWCPSVSSATANGA
uniref:Uncharacterized protein n=1 Tax=Arundo donax TaxID=35708 RepID=A0A0A9CKY0_ARUDO